MTGPWVESPPHVDETRMRHISDRHLLDSLDLTAPGLESVRKAAGDTDQALREWRAYRAGGAAPVPVADIGRWARRRASRPSPPSVDTILEAADGLLVGEPVDFLDSSRGRSRFYGFHYLGWMRPLLEAYALTGRAEYAERYGELFSQWYDARNQVVGDWPGLDIIWYSLGVWARSGLFDQAISLLSGEPAFTDEQWRQTMKCLLGGARWAAEEHATFRNGNWQLVSVTELAHECALYPEFAEHPSWRAVAQRRIEDHLELDFYADGGHHERSPSYHTMCLQALQVAALSADAQQWPLVDHPRLRAAHAWLAEMAHPAGWVPHLQDSHLVYPAEMLLVGHYLYGVPEWKWLVEKWMDTDRIIDRLDWLGLRPDGSDPVESFRAAPSAEPAGRSTLLETSGYAILRQGRSAGDLTTVVNLGPYVGHELEPHSHHASLDFIISGWGEPLAWEAGGSPSYDDPGYYTWYQAGRGHNSVVLDGEPDSAGRNTVMESFWTVGGSHGGVDVVTGRHDTYAQRHRRTMIFVRSQPSYWLVIDDLGGQPVSSTWTIHGRSAWQPDGERRYVSSVAPGLVVVPVEAPAGVTYDTGPARIPGRSEPDEYGTIHGLHLAHGQGTLRTVVVPFSHAPPAVAAEPRDDGAQLQIRLGEARDVFGPGRWDRAYSDGRIEQARWDLDPDARATPDATLDAMPNSMPDDDATPALTGLGVLAWWSRVDDAGLMAEVVTDRRATLTVRASVSGPAAVNGVQVSPGGTGPRQVTVPSQGRWTISLAAGGRP